MRVGTLSSERITRANLIERCHNVNRRIAPTGRYVEVQGRNGYIGLDEYAYEYPHGDTVLKNQQLRTLTCGTTREVGEFLHAMMVGIDLSRSKRLV